MSALTAEFSNCLALTTDLCPSTAASGPVRAFQRPTSRVLGTDFECRLSRSVPPPHTRVVWMIRRPSAASGWLGRGVCLIRVRSASARSGAGLNIERQSTSVRRSITPASNCTLISAGGGAAPRARRERACARRSISPGARNCIFPTTEVAATAQVAREQECLWRDAILRHHSDDGRAFVTKVFVLQVDVIAARSLGKEEEM